MRLCIAILISFCTVNLQAQELFPLNLPASTIPKGTLGVRAFDESYKELNLYRNLYGVRVMYGITSKLMVIATGSMSNYHEKTLPFDFITHNHTTTQLIVGTNTPQEGIPYPYIFNGVDMYAQYRIVANDGQNEHFRVSAYGEGSYITTPSHQAEPDLLAHTKGVGAGLIATYLKKRFAMSLTAGGIIPFDYRGNTVDRYGGTYPTTIQFGDAVNYDLSFGYLLFPRKYKNYNQTNWNIYCEFVGKSYTAAKVWQQDGQFNYDLPITTPILKAGSYVDINPGIQCLIRSNLRIDFSVGFPMINESYIHLYPLYTIGIQRYFYL